MKALVFTIIVMTVIVLGLPALELFVIQQGWGMFAGLIIFLLVMLVLAPGFIFYPLLRYCVYNKYYRYLCETTIWLGSIKTIYTLWDMKPEGSGSIGIATAIALTVFTVLFCLGFGWQTRPTIESTTRVMMDDMRRKNNKKK